LPRASLFGTAASLGFLGHFEQTFLVVNQAQANRLIFDGADDPIQAEREAWRAVLANQPLDQILADAVPRPEALAFGRRRVEAQELP